MTRLVIPVVQVVLVGLVVLAVPVVLVGQVLPMVPVGQVVPVAPMTLMALVALMALGGVASLLPRDRPAHPPQPPTGTRLRQPGRHPPLRMPTPPDAATLGG